MSFLKLDYLSKHFGGLEAVADLSVEISRGEIRGLIGPNGAGKTTAFHVISGVYKPTKGQVFLDGEDITGLPIHELTKKGIARTFQLNTLFRDFSVLKNIMAAFHMFSRSGFWRSLLNTQFSRREEEGFREKAEETLRFLGIETLKNEIAKNLSYGHQRVVALGMALVLEPKLLLLDEPLCGMNPQETQYMMNRIRNVRAEKNITIFLVEHNMQAVMDICEQITVLNFGKKIAEGTPMEVQNNPIVIEAYLGAGVHAV